MFDFAATHRLPAIYETEFYARDGGLMSYGGNLGEIYERAAALTHRILEGAKPAELPFEQPTRYDPDPSHSVGLLRVPRNRPRGRCGAEQCDKLPTPDLPPPHEHLPRKRTLLSTAVKHERVGYAIGGTFPPLPPPPHLS